LSAWREGLLSWLAPSLPATCTISGAINVVVLSSQSDVPIPFCGNVHRL
jgi:hypothetical protein